MSKFDEKVALYKKFMDDIKDKNDKLILLYTNNPEGQHTYIESAKSRGYTVLVMDVMIDNHFMQHLEMKDGDITFKRVDADAFGFECINASND